LPRVLAQVVFWPPARTREEDTGFNASYWPALILSAGKGTYRVEYDNGECCAP